MASGVDVDLRGWQRLDRCVTAGSLGWRTFVDKARSPRSRGAVGARRSRRLLSLRIGVGCVSRRSRARPLTSGVCPHPVCKRHACKAYPAEGGGRGADTLRTRPARETRPGATVPDGAECRNAVRGVVATGRSCSGVSAMPSLVMKGSPVRIRASASRKPTVRRGFCFIAFGGGTPTGSQLGNRAIASAVVRTPSGR